MTSGELWMGFATILALVVGPVIAVWITRINDNRHADNVRKMDIFRILMRTRRMPLHDDHVGALNLVEVEFIKNTQVINAWKNYLSHLAEKLPPIEEKHLYDIAIEKRDTLLTKLISEISIALNIQIEQLDILERNYVPQGWADDDWEQRMARRGLINVLHGRSAISIQVRDPTQAQGPYPPPPIMDQNGEQ